MKTERPCKETNWRVDFNLVKTNSVMLCLHCGTALQSFYRWDFKWCSCGSIAIDGGSDYTKISHQSHAQWIWIDKEEDLNTTLVGLRDTKDDQTWCHNCEQLVLISDTEKRMVIIERWIKSPNTGEIIEERDFCKIACKKKERIKP